MLWNEFILAFEKLFCSSPYIYVNFISHNQAKNALLCFPKWIDLIFDFNYKMCLL